MWSVCVHVFACVFEFLCFHVCLSVHRSQMERDLAWKAAYLDKTISNVHVLRLSTEQFERQQDLEKIPPI